MNSSIDLPSVHRTRRVRPTRRVKLMRERGPRLLAGSSTNEGTANDRRFVDRVHRLRTIGLALGAVCLASVLHLHDDPWRSWALLILNTLMWPHIAWRTSLTSKNPRATEFRNLVIDSACGGAWVAIMQFNLLPSVLVITMLTIDRIAAGGMRLLARASIAMAVSMLVTSALLGFRVDIPTPMSVVAACMPLLVVYPIAISMVTHRLADRVARQNRHLLEVGRTDELTQLPNRQHGLAVAANELARHQRHATHPVLIVIDIDRFKDINDTLGHLEGDLVLARIGRLLEQKSRQSNVVARYGGDRFKDINDRYGHPVGDDVLCAVALILRESCRTTDTPARYGGDEFIIIMPDADLRGAERLAERIRQRLHGLVLDMAPGLHCTVSLGAACADDETVDVDTWLQRADNALYRAKAEGRDRFAAEVVTTRPEAEAQLAQAASV